MMTNEDRLTETIAKIALDVQDIKRTLEVDVKEIKTDINDIKVTQAKLTTESGWVKVLFGGAISMILVLLSVLITFTFQLLPTNI